MTPPEKSAILKQTTQETRCVRMNLEQIESFLVLAQRLNFTQAANDLFMAQPALSRLIAAL